MCDCSLASLNAPYLMLLWRNEYKTELNLIWRSNLQKNIKKYTTIYTTHTQLKPLKLLFVWVPINTSKWTDFVLFLYIWNLYILQFQFCKFSFLRSAASEVTDSFSHQTVEKNWQQKCSHLLYDKYIIQQKMFLSKLTELRIAYEGALRVVYSNNLFDNHVFRKRDQ